MKVTKALTLLEKLSNSQVFILTGLFVVVGTEAIVSILDWCLTGKITYDYLLTGLVVSTLFGLPVIGLVIKLLIGRADIKQTLSSAKQDNLYSISLLNSILDSTQDAILVVDILGKIKWINSQFIQMWDIPQEILDSKEDSLALAHVIGQLEDPDGFLSKVRELYAQPYQESFDDVKFKDGRFIERYSRPQLLNDKAIGRVWSFRDVTQRKHAETRLLESKTTLRLIIENIPLRVFWKDTQSRYLGANRLFAKDAGEATPESLLGKDDTQLAWREQAELYRADDQSVMKSGVSKIAYEEPQTTPDDKQIWLRTSKVPLKNEQGIAVGILGIYDDITLQKNIERELWITKTALDQGLSSYLRITSTGQITYANEHFCRLLGYSNSDILNINIIEIDHYLKRDDLVAVWQIIKADGLRSFETKFVRKDGSLLPVEATSTYGEYLGEEFVFIFVQDISARKQEEERLKQAEQRWKFALEGANSGVWDWTVGTDDLFITPRAKEIFGYSDDAIKNSFKTWQDLIHPEDVQFVSNNIQAYLKGEIDSYQNEHRVLNKNGVFEWAKVRGACTSRNEFGHPLRMVGTVENINAVKLAEFELLRSQTLLRSAMESTDEGILMVAQDGQILSANQRMYEMWRVPSELVEQHSDDVLMPHALTQLIDPEQFLSQVKRLYDSDEEFTEMLSLKDGRVFSRFTKAMLVGGARGRIWCFRDVTDAYNAQIKLKEVNDNLEITLNAIPDLMFELDQRGTYLNIFSHNEELLIAQKSLLLGHTIEEMLPPVAAGICMSALKEAELLGYSHGQVIQIDLAAGTSWFELSTAVKSTTPKYKKFIMLSRDITDRKLIENALEESNYFIRESQRAARIGSYKLNFISGMWESSETLDHIFGIDKSYPRSVEGWLELIYPDDQNEMQHYLADEILRNHKPFHKEYRIVRAINGEVRWVLGQGELSIDADGKLSLMFGTIQDITQRKSIELVLADNEQRFRSIMEYAPIGLVTTGVDGKFILLNEAFCKMVGYTKNELQQMVFLNITHPEDQELTNDDRQKLLRGEIGSYQKEKRYIKKDGGIVWVNITSSLVSNKGVSPYFIAQVEDITERKIAEIKIRKSEEEQRHLLQMLPYGLLIHRGGKILWTNQSAMEMFGVATSEQLIGLEVMSLVHPEYREIVLDRIKAAVNQREDSGKIDEKLLRPDGKTFDAEVAAISILFDGKPASLAVFNDITQRKRDEDGIRLAASVYQNSSEGMLVVDAKGKIVAINPAFTKLTGYTIDEVVGKSPSILQSGRQSKDFYRDMWTQLLSTGHWEGELWNRRKNGDVYPEYLAINIEKNEDGSVHRYVGLFSDISDQKKKAELILRQANYDTLTGLPNRSLFYDRLEQESKKIERTNSSLGLLFIDLDRFKDINDTLGHEKGDILLIEAAERIRNCVRESDTIARLGGDEFTVILPEYDKSKNIDRITRNILSELSKPFDLGGGNIGNITASIGITLYPEDTNDLKILLQHADQAMYAAKSAGRNTSSYFTFSMQRNAQEKMALTNDLRLALANKQLEVYYQPIIDVRDRKISKAEALLRWHHPTRGMVSPAIFIPLAEESGLILEIGDWVFQEVIANIALWYKRLGRIIQISVNKSPVQFERAEIHPWLETLATSQLPKGCITVEITEGMLIKDSVKVKGELNEFKLNGIEVSIDDFGTGFSALSYLKQFDIDYLKIDQSFVRNLQDNDNDKALVEAIIVMAHKLKIKTIAEGVETEVQRDTLIAFGCDYIQGYLYACPLPASEFAKLLVA